MSFNLESFIVLDTVELIVSIWWSADHVKSCATCCIKIYLEFCIETLKTRWMPERASFDEIKNKIMANDKSFVSDLNNFPSADKQYLIGFVNDI